MTDFLDWYALYPRKVARAAAQKAWNRLTLPERQQAIEALPAHAHRWRMTATPWEWIPHPASWLNQQRFADELPNNAGSGNREVRNGHPSVATPPPSNAAPVLQAQPVSETPLSLGNAWVAPTIRLATGPRSIGEVIQQLKAQIGVRK